MPNKDVELYIGLMCGTSADGIDAALVQFPSSDKPQLLATHEHILPKELRSTLLDLNNDPIVSLRQLSHLDTQVAHAHAAAVKALLSKAELKATQICAIGFHGQTIDHAPSSPIYNTTQIGNGHLLAAETNISVVGDVRRADVAAGGHGAPLAPALHAELLRNAESDVAVVNIGGIANLSLLPANPTRKVLGFDTGPGNCLMDEWANKHIQQPFDVSGQFAERGIVNRPLLRELLSFDYFKWQPPKTSGRDVFNLNWLHKRLAGRSEKAENVQATLLALTAQSIGDALEQHLPSANHLYVCGGGVKNKALMCLMQQLMPNNKIESTKKCGIEPDWMESVLMAWLARQYCLDLPGNLPSVTGAKSSVRLGVRFDPPSRT